MTQITIQVPADTPAHKLAEAMSVLGLGIRWKRHNEIHCVKKIKCESCSDTGFQSVGQLSTICHCRIEVK